MRRTSSWEERTLRSQEAGLSEGFSLQILKSPQMRTRFTLETWQGTKALDSETQTQGLPVTARKKGWQGVLISESVASPGHPGQTRRSHSTQSAGKGNTSLKGRQGRVGSRLHREATVSGDSADGASTF